MPLVKINGVSWFSPSTGSPPWFNAGWPLSGHRVQEFNALDPTAADELLLEDPSIQVDLESVRIAIRFTGFANYSSTWAACFRQQVLVHIKDGWILLFAPAFEKSIRKGMREIDRMDDLSDAANPVYLKLNRQDFKGYIETIRLLLKQPDSQDSDEIERIAKKYFPKDDIGKKQITKGHSELTQDLLNLGELLIAWGVPNSPLWPELTNEFKDFDALAPYLDDRKILYAGGVHPSHAPADSRFIQLAKKWLELQRDQGGPATDKQRNFVAAISKNTLGVRPAELVDAMPKWNSDPDGCAKAAADRLNLRLEENEQEWRVDATNGGRCRIVDANTLALKKSQRERHG